MTQPRFAPIQYEDEVRPGYRLSPPKRWLANRPADFTGQPTRLVPGGGVPGPDQGYALLLAERIADRLVLANGEHREDVVIAGVAIALRRAAIFGRAPVLADLEVSFGLLGYLFDAPAALVRARRRFVDGASHDDFGVRELVGRVPESVLREPAALYVQHHERWREVDGFAVGA
ncbi:MAG: hypothetical protein WB770_07370 [Acidimicrobiales bacterium]